MRKIGQGQAGQKKGMEKGQEGQTIRLVRTRLARTNLPPLLPPLHLALQVAP